MKFPLLKKIYLLFVIFFASAPFTSCTEDEMDKINQNKNSPTVSQVDARFQLSDAITSMAFTTYGGAYAWHVASYTEQIFGDGGTQMMYAELRDPIITAAPTTFNNEWNNTYRNLLNIKIIIDKCISGVNKGQTDILGMARVLHVLGFSALMELHGDIPYSEALNEAIRNPKLDAQESIYTSLIKEIDLAIENLSEAVENKMSNGGKQDILFNGDTSKWLGLAYAVKARLLLDGMVLFPENIQSALDTAQLAFEKGFSGAELTIFNGVDVDNAWAAFFKSRHYVGANGTVVDLMKERNDPRLHIYASDLFSTGITYAKAGQADLAATIDNVGGPLWLRNNTASIHLISKASLFFIIAECNARLHKDFKKELEEGIRASFSDYAYASQVEITDEAINSYLENLNNASLKEVMIQKYLSQTRDEQIETYNDLRRCIALGEEFITLKNPYNNNNGLNRWPLSLPYGNSDVVSNPNVAQAFGTGNNAGYYIFSSPLPLFSKQ